MIDWTQVLLALIAAVSSVTAAWIANQARINGNKLRIEVNSRLTQLVEATHTAGYAEGRVQGRTDVHERNNAEHATRLAELVAAAAVPTALAAVQAVKESALEQKS